jgi:threonine/homoserine/homoserine lactone efflux protein
MTFWAGVLFQWVNVKAWVMIIGAITIYAAIAAYPWNVAIQSAICLIIGIAATSSWALFGHALRPILTSPAKVRAFNIVMALLLLGSLIPVFTDA